MDEIESAFGTESLTLADIVARIEGERKIVEIKLSTSVRIYLK